MELPTPLIEGTLVRRYKRFLADIRLSDGEVVTVHCPNTGAMLGCMDPGSRVWLSRADNLKRKYPLTWELVEINGRVLVGIHTGRANGLAREAIQNGSVSQLQGYQRVRSEIRYGSERSRVDLLLDAGDGSNQCYVEIKSVTAAEGPVALFPDAVTSRGAKHLRELAAMADQGHRAVIFFCVQRSDVKEVRPADAIDPAYGEALREAIRRKVEAIAYQAEVTPEYIRLVRPLPVKI